MFSGAYTHANEPKSPYTITPAQLNVTNTNFQYVLTVQYTFNANTTFTANSTPYTLTFTRNTN